MASNTEPKPNVGHFDREETLTSNVDEQTVAGDNGGKRGIKERLGFGSKLTKTAPKDGDLGGRWLSTYTGPRTELTDELNSKIRNRIDTYLLPLIFLIYFSESSLTFSMGINKRYADRAQISNRINPV